MNTPDPESSNREYVPASKIETLAQAAEQIQRMVNRLGVQLNAHYQMLREILDAVNHENGLGWYDPDDTGDEYG